MTANLDIYRAANLLIERYGEDASIHASMRADAMMEKGDVDGYAVPPLAHPVNSPGRLVRHSRSAVSSSPHARR